MRAFRNILTIKLAFAQSINYLAHEISSILVTTIAAMREYQIPVPMMDSGPIQILRRING